MSATALRYGPSRLRSGKVAGGRTFGRWWNRIIAHTARATGLSVVDVRAIAATLRPEQRAENRRLRAVHIEPSGANVNVRRVYE